MSADSSIMDENGSYALKKSIGTAFSRTTVAHCRFVLLAEFDIDRGSTLSHIHPNDGVLKGHDHHTLAELMLPDGAHARSEDWTVFLLPANGSSTEESADQNINRSQTYVINLVRTKHDTSVRRGALVKAMAIGTRHPCIRIFKPILLLALDEYFQSPGSAALAKLFEAINSIDLSRAPSFSRAEKFIMRATERRDLFQSRFLTIDSDSPPVARPPSAYKLDSRMQQQQVASSQSLSRKPSSASAIGRIPLSRRNTDGNGFPLTGRASPLPNVDTNLFKDTHVWETSVHFGNMTIPIRWPLDEWDDEVGEYCMSSLWQTFASHPVTGPLHTHLHSNGTLTHPLIVLFNAIVTYKRVIFLGHNFPAATVANHVLAAAAWGSGCGAVLPGIKERISPYANLTSLDTLEDTPGFIAGVTNPRFEELKCWDVLCNIETGKVTVSRYIQPAPALSLSIGSAGHSTWSSIGIGSVNGSMGLSNDGNTSVMSNDSTDLSQVPHQWNSSETGTASSSFRTKGSGSAFRGHRTAGSIVSEFGTLSAGISDARQDSPDNLFVEDLLGCISSRYSEAYVRARISEYVANFTRLVMRHDEQCHGGSPIVELRRFPQQPYLNGQIGSGTAFGDRDNELKELSANAGRIEGFRGAPGYKLWLDVEAQRRSAETITQVDAWHQVSRLRGRGKPISSTEAILIFSTLSKNVQSEEQIVELLALLPFYSGGLLPIASGLFHTSEETRAAAAELLARIASHRDAGLKFVQNLPLYHRLALARIQREVVESLSQRALMDKGIETIQQFAPSNAPLTAASDRSTGSATPARDGFPAAASTFLGSTSTFPQPPRDVAGAAGPSESGSEFETSFTATQDGRQTKLNQSKNSSLSAAFKELNLSAESPAQEVDTRKQNHGDTQGEAEKERRSTED